MLGIVESVNGPGQRSAGSDWRFNIELVQFRDRKLDDPEDLPPGDRSAFRIWIHATNKSKFDLIDKSLLPKIVPGDVLLATNLNVCDFQADYRVFDVGARVRKRINLTFPAEYLHRGVCQFHNFDRVGSVFLEHPKEVTEKRGKARAAGKGTDKTTTKRKLVEGVVVTNIPQKICDAVQTHFNTDIFQAQFQTEHFKKLRKKEFNGYVTQMAIVEQANYIPQLYLELMHYDLDFPTDNESEFTSVLQDDLGDRDEVLLTDLPYHDRHDRKASKLFIKLGLNARKAAFAQQICPGMVISIQKSRILHNEQCDNLFDYTFDQALARHGWLMVLFPNKAGLEMFMSPPTTSQS